jgi:hypothetical protein
MKNNAKRSMLAAAFAAIIATAAGAITAQSAFAAYDVDLPGSPGGGNTCIEKKVMCRLMAHFPDGSTKPIYGTKTCFEGSIWLCPPCGPCEIDDLPL